MKTRSIASAEMEDNSNHFTNLISHYEFVEYEANQLDLIYSFKKSKDNQESIQKKVVSMDKWKFFRNTLICALYFGAFFARPAWC